MARRPANRQPGQPDGAGTPNDASPPAPQLGAPGAGGPQGDIPLDQRNIPAEIPEDAQRRLREMRGGEGRRALFTSDLTVNELALVHDAGFEPVGMVVGSSIYHIGWQPTYGGYAGFGFGYSYTDQELDTLTTAKYQARELAMSRMEAEADALGADGVVGVRLEVGQYDWGADLAEFIAVGTAVRARGGTPGAYRTRFGKPFTSDLSGQEFSTLLKAGYHPLGLTMGVSVYAAYQNGVEFQSISGWQFGWTGMMGMAGGMGSYNQEVQHFTDAIYVARDLAMRRMSVEAQELGAEGVVGMRIEMQPKLSKTDPEFWEEINDRDAGMPANHWRTFVVDMFAIGTAVAPLSAEHEIPKPPMMIFLDT